MPGTQKWPGSHPGQGLQPTVVSVACGQLHLPAQHLHTAIRTRSPRRRTMVFISSQSQGEFFWPCCPSRESCRRQSCSWQLALSRENRGKCKTRISSWIPFPPGKRNNASASILSYSLRGIGFSQITYPRSETIKRGLKKPTNPETYVFNDEVTETGHWREPETTLWMP